MPVYVVMLILAFVLLAINDDPYEMINKLITYHFVSQESKNVIPPIFQFLFIAAIIPITVITIHMAINNKKRALHDLFSNTCVVYLVPMRDGDSSEMKLHKITLNLPGMIDEEVIGELDHE